jgi:hypothetical protein
LVLEEEKEKKKKRKKSKRQKWRKTIFVAFSVRLHQLLEFITQINKV